MEDFTDADKPVVPKVTPNTAENPIEIKEESSFKQTVTSGIYQSDALVDFEKGIQSKQSIVFKEKAQEYF